MSFEDRFSGDIVGALPAGTYHAGRWIVRDADATHVNRVPACPGDALMPGPTGEWEVARPEFEEGTGGRFFSDALPRDQDADALRQLGQLLRDPSNDSWLAWSEINPLAPGLDEAVRFHRFEDRIENELQHLEAVCRRPRTHIRVEVERELVGRARRIARDAAQWLAAHTEDWRRRTLTGVQPRRIRAEVREERWDLYENRVAARLIDNLVVWLRHRHDEVRRIMDDILKRIEDIEDTARGGRRHRTERIYGLWGEAWKADWQEVAAQTLERIERLLYKILALQDSRLYQQVSQRSHVPRTLRMTNLLNTDDHYRGVARLWRHWSLLPTQGSLSAHMHYKQQQDMHESYDAWCLLLVVRACSQLRLDPATDDDWESSLAKGQSIRLERSLCIVREEGGAIAIRSIQEDGSVLCRFVPLLHSLERAGKEQALTQCVEPIVDAVVEKSHWTVVLHLSKGGSAPCDAIATIGNPPQPGTQGAIDFIRVSPFSLDCVERVARAIRWATLVPRMLAYPPSVPVLPDESLGKELRLEKRDGQWAMVSLSRDHGWTQTELERSLRTEQAKYKDLRRQRDDAKQKQDRREARRLLEPVRAAEKAVHKWRIFKRSVDAAIADLDELRTCPRCGEQAELHERANRCFTAKCESDSCQVRWEIRALPNGKGRVPVFDPDGPAGAPYEIDGLVGCDILAVPSACDGDHLAPRQSSVTPEIEQVLER